MHALKKTLKSKLSVSKKIALLGIGSEFCADDAVGPLVLQYAKKNYGFKKNNPALKVFFGGTAPENITGEIKKFLPSHIIMIDAADMGLKAGQAAFIDPARVSGVSFSTHRLPTTIIAEYLLGSFPCEVIIIGIQPKSLEFGKPASPVVKRTAKQLALFICEVADEISD